MQHLHEPVLQSRSAVLVDRTDIFMSVAPKLGHPADVNSSRPSRYAYHASMRSKSLTPLLNFYSWPTVRSS